MSRTALVVVIILALALGAIFVILQNAPSKGPAPGVQPRVTSPIAGIDHQAITSIRITHPDATDHPAATLTHTAGAPPIGTWTLDRLSTRWPVNPTRVLDLLRTLDAAVGAPPSKKADDAESTVVNPIILDVATEAHTTTVRVSTTPLAGAVGVEASNGFTGIAPASLLHLLTKPGPASWRLTTPLPGLEPSTATHLTITAHDRTIELARLDKRWRVVRPVAARANPVVVQDALTHLGAYTISRFFDSASPPPADDALASPALTLAIARDQPPGEKPRLPTDRRTISFGAPLEGGAAWYASIDKPDPVIVELKGPPPTSFSTAVRNYLATTATDVAPADVGALRLTWKNGLSRLFKRKLDAWVEMPDDTPAQADSIYEALTFLHTEPAEPQESLSETDVRTLLRVELLDFADAPLDVLNVGYNADGELTVRGTNVIWLYGNYRGPALFDLPDFKDLPAEPGVPPAPKREEYPSK